MCVFQLNQELEDQAMETLANRHRTELSDLFEDKNRPSFNDSGVNIMYAVSVQFVKKWKQFVRFVNFCDFLFIELLCFSVA